MKKTLSSALNLSKYVLIVVSAIFLMRCKTENKEPQKEDMKDIYVDQFKLTYFRMFLKKSYNNSKAVQEIIAQDHSGFTEPVLSMQDLKFIDSLTNHDYSILRADSASSIGRVAEGA